MLASSLLWKHNISWLYTNWPLSTPHTKSLGLILVLAHIRKRSKHHLRCKLWSPADGDTFNELVGTPSEASASLQEHCQWEPNLTPFIPTKTSGRTDSSSFFIHCSMAFSISFPFFTQCSCHDGLCYSPYSGSANDLQGHFKAQYRNHHIAKGPSQILRNLKNHGNILV